ncbi:MAG: HD domain-containing protein [Ignavibacteriae bacterium]|nr:HD domain-containing protein [Ignavibacteriota bacterium]
MINILEIENYIKNYYDKNNPPENVYHNLNHILEVVEAVKRISDLSNLKQDETNLIIAAAWFHDVGHFNTWEGHEELSADFAVDYLLSKNIAETEIEIITNCIKVTALPHNPKNLLEEIICDADVCNVGSDSFFEKSKLLRIEIASRRNKVYSEIEWMKKNMDFVIQTKFHTKAAWEIFEEKKQNNLKKLYSEYKKFTEN